jgi:TATA-box binding protein (TBP) (component of TFIID and TFIIIB)
MALSVNTINNVIDDEWSNFISKKYDSDEDDDESIIDNTLYDEFNEDTEELNSTEIFEGEAPEPTNIYISTKTKIAYLERPIDLKIFWDIPIISYATPSNGVIKKQIKLKSKSLEDLELVQEQLKKELYYEEHIMSHIDNPNGRIKFKDIRKITIGMSKKDIMSCRSKKKKQAFYNCFVMILRIKFGDVFREFHIKVFNTGKLEIPGVQSEPMFETVLTHIIQILTPHHDYDLIYNQKSDTVLINSNFNCGFFVNREVLFDILRSKYNIQAIYDPCSYPGIQCKFYYNEDIGVQTGMQITTENKKKYKNITKVSFMIFRTGSVLIVGKCDENILQEIYGYLKALLKTEFNYICQKLISADNMNLKDKKKKLRKKTVHILTGIPEETEKDVDMEPLCCTSLISNINTDNISDNISEIITADIFEDIIVQKPKKTRNKKSNKLSTV